VARGEFRNITYAMDKELTELGNKSLSNSDAGAMVPFLSKLIIVMGVLSFFQEYKAA